MKRNIPIEPNKHQNSFLLDIFFTNWLFLFKFNNLIKFQLLTKLIKKLIDKNIEKFIYKILLFKINLLVCISIEINIPEIKNIIDKNWTSITANSQLIYIFKKSLYSLVLKIKKFIHFLPKLIFYKIIVSNLYFCGIVIIFRKFYNEYKGGGKRYEEIFQN